MSKFRQEVINIKFAEILNNMGFQAVGEIIYNKKLPDIMIKIKGLTINIEGWFKKSIDINRLKSVCKERIEQRICDIAIGLLYPQELTDVDNYKVLEEKIKESNYRVFIFSPSLQGIKEQDLGNVNFEQLVESLNRIYGEVIKQDLLKESIDKIENVIQECTEIILKNSNLFLSSEKVIKELENVLGIEEEIKKEIKSFEENLIRIALFVIFNGLLFHQVLSTHHIKIKGLDKIFNDKNVICSVKKVWETIMEINYLPIFTLAYNVINCLPISPETNKILKNLIPVVLEIVSSGVLLKHDLMGRIYHKLLLRTTGKFYASYYTSIPAATLLSNLVVKTENPDISWNFGILDNLKNFKVLDPACGSGTLLSGMYGALKDKYILENYKKENPDKLDFKSFHKLLIEQVLHGWDILDYAGHLTLTTLALHNSKALFKRSNIYILPSGIIKNNNQKNDVVYLGSLSFLEKQPSLLLPIKDFITPQKEKGIAKDRETSFTPESESIDVVIMNPPFSRSAGKVNIKFGYVEKNTAQRMNKKLLKLGKLLGYKKIGQAGLGAYFIILADKLLKHGGRLALVIPRAILSGVSWQEIRTLLLTKYEIEYIISNYDPEDKNNKESITEPWNWSENTDLGEILLIARKTKKSLDEKYTTFVNLWKKPVNEIQSLKITSDAIKTREAKEKANFFEDTGNPSQVTLDEKIVGVIYNTPQKYLKINFLIPCLFANPVLNKFIFKILNNNLFPLTSLGNKTTKLGVDRKVIETNFNLVEYNTFYPVLWGHSTTLNTIYLDNNYQYVLPKKENKEKAIKIYEENKSHLLIAERIWTNTLSILSIYSKKPIIASLFWEVSLEESEAKILNLWFNSTFGFLLILAFSINNKGNWFNLKKEQLFQLPVIDTKKLSKEDRKSLLNLFDKLKNEQFNPFPEEFKLAAQGKGNRKLIDEEILKIFNLNIDLQPYYEIISQEPIITLKRLG